MLPIPTSIKNKKAHFKLSVSPPLPDLLSQLGALGWFGAQENSRPDFLITSLGESAQLEVGGLLGALSTPGW